MKKLFDKDETTFAIILIVVYVVGNSIMARLSEAAGISFLAEMFFNIIIGTILFIFIVKNGLMKHIGLCRSEVSAAKMWFYIPLWVIAAGSLFLGIEMELPPAAMACRTVSMLFVGFIEEVIFRGFLFRGIAKQGLTGAIIISSLTFGIGHIVNLFNGYSIINSIIQIIFAVGAGFMLVMITVRTGSIIACIAFHSLNNIITAFTSDKLLADAVGEANADIIHTAFGLLVMAVYTLWIIRCIPKRKA